MKSLKLTEVQITIVHTYKLTQFLCFKFQNSYVPAKRLLRDKRYK